MQDDGHVEYGHGTSAVGVAVSRHRVLDSWFVPDFAPFPHVGISLWSGIALCVCVDRGVSMHQMNLGYLVR